MASIHVAVGAVTSAALFVAGFVGLAVGRPLWFSVIAWVGSAAAIVIVSYRREEPDEPNEPITRPIDWRRLFNRR